MLKHILAGLTLAVASCAPPAYAQMRCAPLGDFLAAATAKYAEAPVFQGAAEDGSVLLIVGSVTGSFTAVRVHEGVACYITSGEGASVRMPKAPERGS